MAQSIAFVLFLLMAAYSLGSSPLLSIVFLLAALDQLEDVNELVTGERMVKSDELLWVDIVLEGVVAIVGAVLALASLVYLQWFEGPFWLMAAALSVLMVITSVEDIIDDVEILRGSRSREYVVRASRG